MLLLNRVIVGKNGVLTDYSRELSDYNVGGVAVTFNHAQDCLYVGSDLPFNHRYFSLNNVNAIPGVTSVSIWNGTAFLPAVDVIDLTATSGVPFSKDGILMWTTDRAQGWAQAPTTENIPELASIKIYNAYWVKLTFSADFAQTFRYVGHKFAKDQDLNAYYTDLNRASVRQAYFGSVTANWNELHIAAAEEIVRDLRSQAIIQSVNQVFDPDTFRDSATHKLAEIVYSSFGPSHSDRVDFAVRKYKESMNKLAFNVDKDKDGRLEEREKVGTFRLRRQ